MSSWSELEKEIESWKEFPHVMRGDDRRLWEAMVQNVRENFAEAVEKSGKTFVTDPFFMALLLSQHKMIKHILAELKDLGVNLPEFAAEPVQTVLFSAVGEADR